MKQSQYLKIFRITWLGLAVCLITFFISYNYYSAIGIIASSILAGAFGLARLEDDNYIDDTDGKIF